MSPSHPLDILLAPIAVIIIFGCLVLTAVNHQSERSYVIYPPEGPPPPSPEELREMAREMARKNKSN